VRNHLMFMLRGHLQNSTVLRSANKSSGPEPLTKRVIVIRDAPSGEGRERCERLKSRFF
jgi:hypothetical protein